MSPLTHFLNGFQSHVEMSLDGNSIVCTGKHVHKACDAARAFIIRTNLPLIAQVTNYKTFIVKES